MQWGTSGSIASASSGSVSFPTSFTTSVYSITITGTATQNSAQAANWVDTISTSSFTIHNQGSSSSTFYWMAVGK